MKNWHFYVGLLVVGLGIALGIAFLSPLASSHPDGLEKVAEDEEFINEAKDAPYEVIPDYLFPGVENEDVATVLSGIVGVVVVAALTLVVAFVLRRTGRGERTEPTSRSGGET